MYTTAYDVLTEEETENLKEKYHLKSIRALGNEIFISTYIARWSFKVDDCDYVRKLYHESTKRSYLKTFRAEYHLQKYRGGSLEDTIKFICSHDAYVMKGRQEKVNHIF